jgi:regulator of sirC expression with transglutaminase-like and TPR domain
LSKAIDLDPSIAVPYYYRGLAYGEQGRKAEAIADLGKFISLTDNTQWIALARKEIEKLTE